MQVNITFELKSDEAIVLCRIALSVDKCCFTPELGVSPVTFLELLAFLL